MKKIKITREGNVNCPRKTVNPFVPVSFCRDCESCFGIVAFSHVNCKQGTVKDVYLKGNYGGKKNGI